ncbi:MAG: hypothetical protein Q8R37_04955 [Nanoarchaeota archaeon]|nr:hypothetical protein [Nanoarchaeota archaeon]
MWKAVTTSLCALLFYSAVPSGNTTIPPGKEHHFEYTLHGPEFMFKPDVGSVVWEYRYDLPSKGVPILKSHFEVKTDSKLVKSITGVNITSIRSTNDYNDGNFALSRYFYELKENIPDTQGRNTIIEQLKFGLLFQNRQKECKKWDDGKLFAVSCGDTPSGNVPDLFAVLAAVIHAPNLEKIVDAKWEWPAVYGRQEEKVSLEKMEEKIITRDHSTIPLVLYNVRNIDQLLGEKNIAIRLGLRKEHPHFMEYAEIETTFGTLTLERKE